MQIGHLQMLITVAGDQTLPKFRERSSVPDRMKRCDHLHEMK